MKLNRKKPLKKEVPIAHVFIQSIISIKNKRVLIAIHGYERALTNL